MRSDLDVHVLLQVGTNDGRQAGAIAQRKGQPHSSQEHLFQAHDYRHKWRISSRAMRCRAVPGRAVRHSTVMWDLDYVTTLISPRVDYTDHGGTGTGNSIASFEYHVRTGRSVGFYSRIHCFRKAGHKSNPYPYTGQSNLQYRRRST